jgi:hypothetical protein
LFLIELFGLCGLLCTNPYIVCTVKYRTELRHRRDQNAQKLQKIAINDQLYQAIKEKADQNGQTADQYAENLLEKALTKEKQ